MTTGTATRIDVFISHATADDACVTRIHDALTAAGLHAWVDHVDGIGPGDRWPQQIQDAANACRYGLLVLSRESAQSAYCEAEWSRVLARGVRLYIALIEDVPLTLFPLRLGTIQYTDVRGPRFDDGMAELIRAMQGDREPDRASPVTGQARRLTGTFPRWHLDIPLIGRGDDLERVHAALADGARAVTILGFGGIGKTRLAAEIASTAPFADGAAWFTLTDTSTPARLIDLVRAHLELPPATDPDAVWAALGRRALLIVLDNAEDCANPAAFAERLNMLDLGGGTRVVITSRRQWPEVHGARRIELRAPDLDAAAAIVRAMAAYEPPDYPLDGHERAIAEAARQHPRLIYYAVHWANHHPPGEVIALLRDLHGADPDAALDDLVRKTVDGMTAQPGGAGALAALRRLAVCRGGFTLDAARAILGGDDAPLRLLRQWGLVSFEDGRHDVDPLVIAAVGADPDAHRPHYDFYKALANEHDDRQDYLGLDVESRNLEAAFEWAMRSGDAEAALWLANAVGSFLANRGRFEQRMDWLERAAAALADHPDRMLWANAQNSLGIAYQEHPFGDRRANLRRAVAAYTEALRFRTPQAAPLAYATTQNNLGAAYRNLAAVEERAANLRRAVAAYTEALRFYTPQAAPLDYATTQNNLGAAYRNLAAVEERAANLRRAVAAYTEALRFRTPQAAPLDYAMTQNNLGAAYADLAAVEERAANLRRAVAAFEEALRFRTPQAAPLDYAMTQRNMGIAQEQLGDLPAAVACWREAERYYRQMGDIANADLMQRWIDEAGGGGAG